MDLTTFLRERWNEEEQLARDAADERTGIWTHAITPGRDHKVIDDLGYSIIGDCDVVTNPWWTSPHIARWDPAHVQRDIAAKRKILDDIVQGECSASPHVADRLLMLLATPYAEHPDYLAEWKP